ncbi:MAG: hypothetical protein AAGN82_27840 [Myxococcota bacterium]
MRGASMVGRLVAVGLIGSLAGGALAGCTPIGRTPASPALAGRASTATTLRATPPPVPSWPAADGSIGALAPGALASGALAPGALAPGGQLASLRAALRVQRDEIERWEALHLWHGERHREELERLRAENRALRARLEALVASGSSYRATSGVEAPGSHPRAPQAQRSPAATRPRHVDPRSKRGDVASDRRDLSPRRRLDLEDPWVHYTLDHNR